MLCGIETPPTAPSDNVIHPDFARASRREREAAPPAEAAVEYRLLLPPLLQQIATQMTAHANQLTVWEHGLGDAAQSNGEVSALRYAYFRSLHAALRQYVGCLEREDRRAKLSPETLQNLVVLEMVAADLPLLWTENQADIAKHRKWIADTSQSLVASASRLGLPEAAVPFVLRRLAAPVDPAPTMPERATRPENARSGWVKQIIRGDAAQKPVSKWEKQSQWVAQCVRVLCRDGDPSVLMAGGQQQVGALHDTLVQLTAAPEWEQLRHQGAALADALRDARDLTGIMVASGREGRTMIVPERFRQALVRLSAEMYRHSPPTMAAPHER